MIRKKLELCQGYYSSTQTLCGERRPLIGPFGATLRVIVAGSRSKTVDGVAIYPLARFRTKKAWILPDYGRGYWGGWRGVSN